MIFKAYDIRGLFPEEIDQGMAYLIGRAFITYTKAKRVLVGNDMRNSSEPLKEALIQGLTDQGADVVDTDLCSTPMFYFSTQKYEAGIMVTASHNPKQYNGFKLCREKATPIGQGSGMEEIKELVLTQEFPAVTKKGTVKTKNYLQDYVAFCLSFLSTKKPFRVVVDTANGMGGHTYTELTQQIPKNIEFIPLYWELDGTFPNHEANPLKYETLKSLQEKILEEKADFGIAIDGDADRVMFVDNEGNVVDSALSATLISEELIKKGKKKILYDLRSSKIFKERVEELGAQAIESRVGHAFIKNTMREQKIAFGAEVSGHMYHEEMEYCESEIIPLLRMMNLLENNQLSEKVQELRKYVSISETNYTVEDANKVMELVEKSFENPLKVTKIDGLKMEFENWWFSLRSSNTEPLLRLNLEADNQRILKEKTEMMEKLIQNK